MYIRVYMCLVQGIIGKPPPNDEFAQLDYLLVLGIAKLRCYEFSTSFVQVY